MWMFSISNESKLHRQEKNV